MMQGSYAVTKFVHCMKTFSAFHNVTYFLNHLCKCIIHRESKVAVTFGRFHKRRHILYRRTNTMFHEISGSNKIKLRHHLRMLRISSFGICKKFCNQQLLFTQKKSKKILILCVKRERFLKCVVSAPKSPQTRHGRCPLLAFRYALQIDSDIVVALLNGKKW